MGRVIIILIVLFLSACYRTDPRDFAQKAATLCDSVMPPPPPVDSNVRVPILFIGQSNIAGHRPFISSTVVPHGYGYGYYGSVLIKTYGVVDWADLPDTSGYKISSLQNNEGTMIPRFVYDFHTVIGGKASIVKYAASSSKYDDWKDTTTGTNYPIYRVMKQTVDTFMKRQSLTRDSLKFVVMYLGESDGLAICADSNYRQTSINALYSLVDRLHRDFVNAKILIIETSYPANQTVPCFVKLRKIEDSAAITRPFIYIVDTTTKYFPKSWSVDGLHLLDTAYDHMAKESVKNIKTLFY